MQSTAVERLRARRAMAAEDAAIVDKLFARPLDEALRSRVAKIYKRHVPYQARDWEIVDYDLVRYPFGPHNFRAPNEAGGQGYFVALGSAATFGATSPLTYGGLLSKRLGLSCINLGMGGAGPEYYLTYLQDEFWEICNGAEFVIIEAMSPSCVSNHLFTVFPPPRPNGAPAHGSEVVRARRHYIELERQGKQDEVRKIIASNTTLYIEQLKDLCHRISVPKIGLWFSRHLPDALDASNPNHLASLLSQFPQMMDAAGFKNFSETVGNVCIATTSRGDSIAVDRFTHLPTVWKNGDFTSGYYPSSGMHIDAANLLEVHLKDCGLVTGQ